MIPVDREIVRIPTLDAEAVDAVERKVATNDSVDNSPSPARRLRKGGTQMSDSDQTRPVLDLAQLEAGR